MKIGVESAHSFGDACFNIPLIKALSSRYKTKIAVATRKPYIDAFHNIPYIDKIIPIDSMGEGIPKLQQMGYQAHQITQNIKFFEFKQSDPEHSLIDTPLATGRQMGLEPFNQRPIFAPTLEEHLAVSSLVTGEPTIAIESEYRSGQSWATPEDFELILNHHACRILWLSNKGAPSHVDNMLRYTRRQVILSLQACDTFYSVGSGFFCACLALPSHLQPKKIVCLWDDTLYKYERRLNELKWHPQLVWVHNRQELEACLTGQSPY